MKQGLSWEANRFSASHEIPRILWNQKVHHRFFNSPSPIPILSRINPVHVSHPTSWRSNLILSFIYAWVFQVVFSLRFPHQTLYAPLLSPHTMNKLQRTRSSSYCVHIRLYTSCIDDLTTIPYTYRRWQYGLAIVLHNSTPWRWASEARNV